MNAELLINTFNKYSDTEDESLTSPLDKGDYGFQKLHDTEFEYEGGKFTASTVHVEGGSEGEGEEHYVVLKVLNNGEETFWKVPGWYQSYHGAELEVEDLFQVKPVEKTYTDYDPID